MQHMQVQENNGMEQEHIFLHKNCKPQWRYSTFVAAGSVSLYLIWLQTAAANITDLTEIL